MKIGIIVAMDKELNLLLPLLESPTRTVINDTTFHTGRLDCHDVVILKSGIGKVNAAVATLTLIENFHVSFVINTGVAGGTGQGARILDVVIGDRVAYHDVWCGPGTTDGQAAGCPAFFEAPFSAETLDTIPGTRHGLIASGDIFVSRPEDVARILKLYPDAMAVDMESAAIAQVCHLKNVPFLAVRVVSDTPGQADNISQYENFWDDAPREAFTVLRHILTIL
ncbi:MAG: 5'-methylthioadenosine/adenosylhomocysteine nucleosidase [Muribaculaceae bacterium]|nr:5'-methylthioadenosine/adenosylhomocysteine nucleosidase [Muribaculaceae bacterium]